MNDPETWEVFIAYNEVPFTEQGLEGDKLEYIDIDSEDSPKIIEQYEELKEYLPLITYEDAIRFKEALDDKSHSLDLYSSVLIQALTAE